jgi:ABC-type nitrate/sulfonate/bicarbonate transport system ATPase subunit
METRLEAPRGEPLSVHHEAVTATGLRRAYPGRGRNGEVLALEGVDLSVARGEVVTVLGPSGCGKSTLLELMGGLQEPDGGRVAVWGRVAPDERRSEAAYMPQRDMLLPWRNALANAALALECRGVPAREARVRAAPLFERFGLAEFERALPSELSGGMRQRVAFLRTLLAERPVLLLDEPFAALDSITRASMQEWLMGALQEEPRTVVCVTHDVDEALFLADRVVVLSPRPGRTVAELSVDFPRPRSRLATVTDSRFVELKERALRALGS